MAMHEVTTTYIENMQFKTDSPTGYSTFMDTSPENGGANEGMGPKALMLSSLAGCTGLDVVFVLNKMRVPVPLFEIKTRGKLSGEHPKIYDEVWVDYHFYGKQLEEEKIRKAVALSAEQYCGVMAMFRAFCTLHIDIHFHAE